MITKTQVEDVAHIPELLSSLFPNSIESIQKETDVCHAEIILTTDAIQQSVQTSLSLTSDTDCACE